MCAFFSRYVEFQKNKCLQNTFGGLRITHVIRPRVLRQSWGEASPMPPTQPGLWFPRKFSSTSPEEDPVRSPACSSGSRLAPPQYSSSHCPEAWPPPDCVFPKDRAKALFTVICLLWKCPAQSKCPVKLLNEGGLNCSHRNRAKTWKRLGFSVPLSPGLIMHFRKHRCHHRTHSCSFSAYPLHY